MKQFLISLFFMVMIPYVTTLAWTGKVESFDVEKDKNSGVIWEKLGGTNEERIEKSVITMRNEGEVELSVEEFLISVLAAQISPAFEEETIKAQSVLARTYIYGVMDSKEVVTEEELDMDALSLEEMKKLWGEQVFAQSYGKLKMAVKETQGQYLLYEGRYIEPFYCYLSAGKTRRNGDKYPYLKEADSPWDKTAENYRSMPVFDKKLFTAKINEIPSGIRVDEDEIPESIQIAERDGAGYVKQVKIGQKTYTGEEVQYALGLPSPCYSFEAIDGNIRVICKGIGHGYGFSQYGANEMAREGKNYRELLEYYFQNVEIVEII